MTTQPSTIYDIAQLPMEIKAVTKLIIDEYDCKEKYDLSLMAICNQTLLALKKLTNRKPVNIQQSIDDLLHQYFVDCTEIIGTKPAVLEKTYSRYFSRTTKNGGIKKTT